ncbi:MAG TPA: tetratricopeptide repeat protein, partial [Candidatus Caenarcaniphilales bacterium]
DDSIALLLSQEPQWQIGYLPEVAILHEGYQAEAIIGRDKFQTARVAMEKFLINHPQDPYACSKLGALYVQVGDLAQGMALLEQGLRSKQATPLVLYELHYHLGIAYSQLSHPAQAIVHYQAALQQEIPLPLKLGAYNNWGSLLKQQGNLTAAQKVYEMVLQIDPNFAIGHYNLGMTLKAQGDLAAAIAAYNRAIQLNPTYAEAYQNLGVVLLKSDNARASLAAFRQAIALHEQYHPPEADRLRQGLKALGFEV